MAQSHIPEAAPEPLFSDHMPGVDPVALSDAGRADRIPPTGILVEADVFPGSRAGAFLISHYGVQSDALGLEVEPSRPFMDGSRASYSIANRTGFVDAYVGVRRHRDDDPPSRPYYYGDLRTDKADIHPLEPQDGHDIILAVTSTSFTILNAGGCHAQIESGYMAYRNKLSGVRVVANVEEVRILLEAAAQRMGLSEHDVPTVVGIVAGKVGDVALRVLQLQADAPSKIATRLKAARDLLRLNWSNS